MTAILYSKGNEVAKADVGRIRDIVNGPASMTCFFNDGTEVGCSWIKFVK